jgi:hypothetical protein
MSTTARRPRKRAGRRPPKRETTLQLTAQRDLAVLYHIQRVPREDRVRKMRDNYDVEQEGVLLVARITDGPHSGVLHIFDGGTRWLAKADEPDYQFYTVISPMTEQQAAAATYAFNNEQRHHTPYQSHVVGLAAKFALNVAMQEAFDRIPVQPVERSSTRGSIASIKACERIMKDAYQSTFATKGGEVVYPDIAEDDRWEFAIQRLVDVLTLTREAYSDWTAHDADMVQAIAALWSLNVDKIERRRVRSRLVRVLGEHLVSWYRVKAQEMHTTYGGSESRGKTMGRIVATNYNKSLQPDSELWLARPKSKLDD